MSLSVQEIQHAKTQWHHEYSHIHVTVYGGDEDHNGGVAVVIDASGPQDEESLDLKAVLRHKKAIMKRTNDTLLSYRLAVERVAGITHAAGAPLSEAKVNVCNLPRPRRVYRTKQNDWCLVDSHVIVAKFGSTAMPSLVLVFDPDDRCTFTYATYERQEGPSAAAIERALDLLWPDFRATTHDVMRFMMLARNIDRKCEGLHPWGIPIYSQ